MVHGLLAQVHGKAGPVQEALVQSLQGCGAGILSGLLAVGDGELCQLHQHIGEGEEHDGAADVEQAVDHGNVRRAAAALELSRPYLYQKMKQLGINIAELRELSLSHSSADALPSRD